MPDPGVISNVKFTLTILSYTDRSVNVVLRLSNVSPESSFSAHPPLTKCNTVGNKN